MSMIASGSVIGSGIFLTPSLIAKSLPSPMWILFVWILGGVIALTGALTYAGLGFLLLGVPVYYFWKSKADSPQRRKEKIKILGGIYEQR